MRKEQINEIFEIFSANNPHPQGELFSTNPFTLLVAVVLSAQATDKGVNKATHTLFQHVSSPQDMVALGEDGLIPYIATIGLYRSKAKYLIQCSRQLIERFQGQVPKKREDLESLPGVGRKTANVLLNALYGDPVIAVDTHVFRVSNRTGMAMGKTPLEVETKLEAVVPEIWKRHAHHWLVLHGRYICVAKKPKCPICPIEHLCQKRNLP